MQHNGIRNHNYANSLLARTYFTIVLVQTPSLVSIIICHILSALFSVFTYLLVGIERSFTHTASLMERRRKH